jgi:hypothetical protein
MATGFRAAQRRLSEALATARVSTEGTGSLESQRMAPADPPRLAKAAPLEDDAIKARIVEGEPMTGFAAFLDGIQVSRVLAHEDGLPIVHGTVGAVVRERIDRRLATWRSETEQRVYAARAFLAHASNDAIASSGLSVVDITPRKNGEPDDDARHPLSLADVAVSAVQAHRETLELSLAEAWLAERSEALYVDGSISGSAKVATSPKAVGIVKSHRTLYGDAAAVRLILSLRAGERSSVFAVASPNGWRETVASWYLRIRSGAEPLWGLVRVEISLPKSSNRPALTTHADQISRWILAEAAPLALPDGRWDTMAYGIRDCQQFLKAQLR